MPQNDSNHTNLVKLLSQGSEGAFKIIYEHYADELLIKACQKTPSLEIAEELLHNVFLKLWQKRETLYIHTSLKGYLMVMLKNEVLMYYRHHYQEKNTYISLEHANETASPYEAQLVETKDMEEALWNQVERLPERCKVIFRLSREQHFTTDEISQQLNLSPQTVRNQLSKAVRILQASLKTLLIFTFIFFK